MDAHIKEQWVQALRGGGYQQGTHTLRRGNLYCVLGVLCDLHAQATGAKWVQGYNYELYLGCSASLPIEVQYWSNIDMNKVNRLSDMNDKCFSFNALAQWIEEEL